ncbi:MAG: hypothetical protein AAFO96_28710 [Bacteroidota bacterium]
MRKSGEAVQDMYDSWKTMVRCAVTEELKVEVGLHPFLFAMVMNRLTGISMRW